MHMRKYGVEQLAVRGLSSYSALPTGTSGDGGGRRTSLRTAFTLIELLVVISVIALLMSMMIPALARAKQQTKTVICRSNLHQWGLLFEMFLEDNDGKFMSGHEWDAIMDRPSGYAGEGAIDNGGDHSWPLILLPYYKSAKMLRCPLANKRPADDRGERVREDHIFSSWVIWLYYPEEYFYGSYGINSWVYDRGDDSERWRQTPVKRMNEIPLFLDCYWCEGYPRQSDQPPLWNFHGEFGDSGNHMKRFCLNRHEETTNGLFMDYSVRAVGLKELWRLRWHRRWSVRAPMPVWPDWMKHMKD